MLREFEKEIFDNWNDKEVVIKVAVKEIVLRRKMGNYQVDDVFIEKVGRKLNTTYDDHKNEGPSVAPWFVICVMEQIFRNGI